jgi:RHS repeat-associated protein
MLLVGRSWEVGSELRHGFNGKETYYNLYEGYIALDFNNRVYDCRLGRWLSSDKGATLYPEDSPYSYAGNNPIYYIDRNGDWKVVWRDNNDHTKGIVFEAEPGDNLQTLADQMGIPYKDLIDENFSGKDFTLNNPLKGGEWLRQEDLPSIEVFQNINNFLAEDRDESLTNCAGFYLYTTGLMDSKWVEPEDLNDQIKASYDNLESESEAKIGDVTTFSESYEYFDYANGGTLRMEGQDPQEYYETNVMYDIQHYSVVLLKDKSGESISYTIQKSGTNPARISTYPGQKPATDIGTDGINIFRPQPLHSSDTTPIYTPKQK